MSRHFTGAALAILLGAAPLGAQDSQDEPGATGPTAAQLAQRRDPRVADDVPNFSGVWWLRSYKIRFRPDDEVETPWLPWSKETFDEHQAAQQAGSPIFDPLAACLPAGNPRVLGSPYPAEFIQIPGKIIILYETHHTFRVVHMDQPMPEELDPSFMGHSVGHFEGDTLVIETRGIVPFTQIDEAGTLHSDVLKLTERYRKISPETLELKLTIDDPKAFSEPWTGTHLYDWSPDIRLMEYVCEENNRNEPTEEGVLRNF